jgi:hypothetical protein
MQPLRSVGAFNGSKGSCTGEAQAIAITTDSFDDGEEASGGLAIGTTIKTQQQLVNPTAEKSM